MAKEVLATALFIPCYNCSIQFERLLKKLEKIELSSVQNILVVDNCSERTETEKIRTSIQSSPLFSKINLHENETNLGLGGSFKFAFCHLKNKGYTRMILLHGDDQADLSDLLKQEQLLASKFDLLLGARFMNGSELKNYSLMRKFANCFLNWLFSLLIGRKIFDLGSGLNVYNLLSFSEEEIKTLPSHICFDLEILILALKRNLEIVFFPICWTSADEKSTINDWKVGWQLLSRIIFWKRSP